MNKTMIKALALVLLLVQLFTLLPFGMASVQAANTESNETPVLNKLIVGTVKFQSFNFLGDNNTGSDGVDYSSTFYYSDDWFSPSAINEDVSSATMKWSDLENVSLAATSFDLAVASYASNEGNVKTATDRTWANTDYSDKAKNARAMLTTCGFEHFQAYGYDHAPTNDGIAYVIASKPIHVWDAATQSNRDFTLIAVGVRGAGYGAEWASNMTIGDPATNLIPANGRHWGFDKAAQEVCASVRQYLSDYGITENAKYWITGFSRAGATANLVAGYVTDEAESTYHTRQRDVFGYTWACPKGAKKTENGSNFTNYKNIHNIINGMDAVPKVSPDSFQHQRLGVDYYMPYYKNTTTDENEAYYTGMLNVLQTIAVGAYNYAGESYTEDPLIDITSKSKYPYNRPMRIRTITATQLLSDALNGVLADNFGTVDATGSAQRIPSQYIDEFIDNLINVFMVSTAWDRHFSGPTSNILTHRARFISYYQKHFRNAMGYLLDYSGPAFLGLVDKLIDAIGNQFSLTNTVANAGVGLAFLNFYNYPKSTYKLGIPPFIDPWVGSPSWVGRTRKQVLIDEAQPIVRNVVRNMVGNGFNDPQGITRSQFETSLDTLVELIVDLYADELSRYNSNYFGTSLYYMWQILCTHEQEVVMSWIKSLDSMHMNRSTRTLTLPASADVTLYEFREDYAEYDGAPTVDETTAPVAAEIQNGGFVTGTLKDQRITISKSGDSIIIRYPASLELRADIKANSTFDLSDVTVRDYQTKEAHTKVSDGEKQFSDGLPNTSYNNVTAKTAVTNATPTNTLLAAYGSLEAGDTLHVLVNDLQTYDSENETTEYRLCIDKVPQTVVADYASPEVGLSTGRDLNSAVLLGTMSSKATEEVVRGIRTRQTQTVVPASSIYYDDELTGSSAVGYQSETTRLDWNEETGESAGKTVWYQFTGTRIDVYCTTDKNNGYVMAAVTDENGEIVTINGQRMIITMKSQSDTPRYNVPTISFDGLKANTTYYLKIYAIKGANYQLDGIRVYHPADENDATVKAAYEAEGEQEAKYVNLRGLLLGSVSESTLSGNVEDGALFYTDSGTSYSLTSSDYQTSSPKNEIYLANGESVAFQIVGIYEKVAVGMSAPSSRNGGGSVTVTNGETKILLPIGNALDMYYSVIPDSDGNVVIKNTGSAMISITNVKLSGDYTAPANDSLTLAFKSPLRVTRSLMQYAADFSALPEEPEETPVVAEPEETAAPEETPESTPTPTPAQSWASLFSSFVRNLFGGISRLFGGKLH